VKSGEERWFPSVYKRLYGRNVFTYQRPPYGRVCVEAESVKSANHDNSRLRNVDMASISVVWGPG
jgi:hypothetical protein